MGDVVRSMMFFLELIAAVVVLSAICVAVA